MFVLKLPYMDPCIPVKGIHRHTPLPFRNPRKGFTIDSDITRAKGGMAIAKWHCDTAFRYG